MRFACRSAQLYLLAGMNEWELGEVDVARNLFRTGAGLGAITGQQHEPILDAWIQMEDSLGNDRAVDALQARMQVVQQANAATRGRSDSGDMALAGLAALLGSADPDEDDDLPGAPLDGDEAAGKRPKLKHVPDEETSTGGVAGADMAVAAAGPQQA